MEVHFLDMDRLWFDLYNSEASREVEDAINSSSYVFDLLREGAYRLGCLFYRCLLDYKQNWLQH